MKVKALVAGIALAAAGSANAAIAPNHAFLSVYDSVDQQSATFDLGVAYDTFLQGTGGSTSGNTQADEAKSEAGRFDQASGVGLPDAAPGAQSTYSNTWNLGGAAWNAITNNGDAATVGRLVYSVVVNSGVGAGINMWGFGATVNGGFGSVPNGYTPGNYNTAQANIGQQELETDLALATTDDAADLNGVFNATDDGNNLLAYFKTGFGENLGAGNVGFNTTDAVGSSIPFIVFFKNGTGNAGTAGINGRRLINLGDFTLSSAGSLQFNAVPVPAAVWLFGSALAGMVGVSRRQRRA